METDSRKIYDTFATDQLAEDEMKLQHLDGTPPHVLAHERRLKIEKATEKIMRADRPSMDDDEAREVEPGMYFGTYNFLR